LSVASKAKPETIPASNPALIKKYGGSGK